MNKRLEAILQRKEALRSLLADEKIKFKDIDNIYCIKA